MMGPDDTSEGVDLDDNMLPCSAAATADPESKVLDDDNLLIEIIVRLGFPTSLVHAALVCKRWYSLASDPAVLRRFRKLHPPRLLGFYVNTATGEHLYSSRFLPILPRPPELDSVFRHASFSLDAYENGWTYVADCWKNNVLIYLKRHNGGARGPDRVVRNPLFPDRVMAVVPTPPRHQLSEGNDMAVAHLLIEGADSLSFFYVFIEPTDGPTESTVYVYMFKDGVWCMISSATTELHCQQLKLKPLLVNSKIYMLASHCGMLVFDSRTLGFSTVQLPQGVVCGQHFFTIKPLGLKCGGRTRLLRADDGSGVYLIHVNELQLVIWLHEGGNWLLVATICLLEMCADLRISDCRLENGNEGFVEITMVGPNAEFVLLETPLCTFHWDIKCRTLRKVHEITRNDTCLRRIHPFMMIWPPTFPALKDDPSSGGK
ncbi:uncharacterized protein [Lolium perenne]|uniref:uncharacterized protein n=1 Tax=Lolium perenne TaxID=4522 RepID=UPI0021F67E21|nr:uncharacterized protein LOC127342403 [Lolium perenne]